MLKKTFSSLAANIAKRLPIIGYDEFCSATPPKRALLSYLVLPLLPPAALRDKVKFSNRGIAQEIPRVLNELGYKVDIINFNNLSWTPKLNYDLFIGHAGINFERLSRFLPGDATKIYFSTGIYWKEWNYRMARRLYDIALRRAYLLPPERFIAHSEEYANEHADGIICLGNLEAVKSYSKFKLVVGINNAIYPVNVNILGNKNFREGRRHFLFFSGRGNIHKGLDIILEAFSGSDLHLHICQHIQDDFSELYHKELYSQTNIHFHGFVRMRSRRFEKLSKLCNWVISASCAEGQPGAILECMGHGLIPILSDWNNIDLDDWGVRLDNCDLPTIRSTLARVSVMDVEECRLRFETVLKTVKMKYSVEYFRENLNEALKKILNSKLYRLK